MKQILFKKIKTKKTKDKDSKKIIRKHHIWGGIGIIIGIILTILIFSIFSYKYISYIEKESYIKGSQDMANSIYTTVNNNGGAILKIGNNEINLAKYEKVIDSSKITG
jgi:uncharacterized membrane protein YukC